MLEETASVLQLILEHAEVIQSRFSKINEAEDFVTSEEGVILLDAISMRLGSFDSIKAICFRCY